MKDSYKTLQQIYDHSDMLAHINHLPDQLLDAWHLGFKLPLPDFIHIHRIIIAGMGGSAIGGDLLASYCWDSCAVPIYSVRDYVLPNWAQGETTLVICSSHSGNTEETLSVLEDALEKKCSIMALSTGGKLLEQAKKFGITAWQFAHTGQPRTAVGFSFGLLLALLTRLGLVQVEEQIVTAAVSEMKAQALALQMDSDTASNPAKTLAESLKGVAITVFAAGKMEVIARRWKTQINELAKAWAHFEAIPEANHNTLAGSVNPPQLLSKEAVIFLASETDHPRNTLRLKATQQVFHNAGLPTYYITAQGSTTLSQMWYLLHLGDYVAYYLSLLYHVDPTPVDALTQLKTKLAGS